MLVLSAENILVISKFSLNFYFKSFYNSIISLGRSRKLDLLFTIKARLY